MVARRSAARIVRKHEFWPVPSYGLRKAHSPNLVEDEFSEVHTQHSPDPMRYASPDWGRAHLPHRAGAWYPPPALLLLFYVKIHISLTDIHILLRAYTVFTTRLRDRCARGRRTATCPPSRPGPATSNPPPSAFPWAGGRRRNRVNETKKEGSGTKHNVTDSDEPRKR